MLYYRQLNEFLETLEIEILNNNGIIYDNYVCNRLLADHNKQLYIDKQLPMDKFYNISIDNSTIDRFIKSNKIHIAFINNDDYINFYKFISNSSNNRHIKIIIMYVKDYYYHVKMMKLHIIIQIIQEHHMMHSQIMRN